MKDWANQRIYLFKRVYPDACAEKGNTVMLGVLMPETNRVRQQVSDKSKSGSDFFPAIGRCCVGGLIPRRRSGQLTARDASDQKGSCEIFFACDPAFMATNRPRKEIRRRLKRPYPRRNHGKGPSWKRASPTPEIHPQ